MYILNYQTFIIDIYKMHIVNGDKVKIINTPYSIDNN